MADCIFCKIVKKEIPSSTVYENKKVLAFLDIYPVNKGHVLIIPKKHYDTLTDIPDELLADVIKATKKIAKSVMKAMRADGFNVGMNNYKAAGQLVPHAHFHIIPRFSNDGLKLWAQGSYQEGEMKPIAESIKKNIA
jgi:histidine triad (HIT) family protein